MGEGARFRRLFGGIRPVDVVLASALTALGVVLMVGNVLQTPAADARGLADGGLAHTTDSHSWLMVPVFCLTTVPVLWWRRSPIGVTGFVLGAMLLHDLLFGWVTRCGAGLPLVFVLAYLGAVALPLSRALIALGLATVLVLAVLIVDSSAWLGGLLLGWPVTIVVFVIGRAVRHRLVLNAELRAKTRELHELRDRRAALQVAEDRAAVSEQLDTLLQDRLAALSVAAASGRELDAAGARAAFDRIETSSRQTLDDMRQIVGLLRGDEAGLAPAPSVTALDALLARRRPDGTRLTVEGSPRSLPAAVELTTYRIVEHLLDAMQDTSGDRVEVGLRFAEAAIEVRVSGRVERTADLRTAVARARERAAFLGGSLELKTARGRGTAIALLPVGG